MHSRLNDPHGHEMGMSVGPGKRCFFRFKETVDHNCIPLSSSTAAGTRGSSLYNTGTAVDCHTFGIGKNDTTSIWDPFGIDRAMSCAQPGAIGTGADLAFTSPVDGDACEKRFFASKQRSNAQKKKNQCCC